MSLLLRPIRSQASVRSTSTATVASRFFLRPPTSSRTPASTLTTKSGSLTFSNVQRRSFSSSMTVNSHGDGKGESAVRPPPDEVLTKIASYVHNYKIDSDLAYDTANTCMFDALGCGLEGLRFPACERLLGPVVEGTVVPNGAKVPGTPHVLDPIRAAWSVGTMIRWLDFNDCFLAAEWGHPSDNLGAIWAVADYVSRVRVSEGKEPLKVKDILTGMIKAHEIQGCLALLNSYNAVGLDHVVLVKVASTAVASHLLGLSESQTVDAVSQAWVDGQSLRTYRHAPNTGSRKSWAAGDACSRAVNLSLLVKRGEGGIPTVLTAKRWGFYDVLFKGNEFKFQRDYGSYIMENVLFKISFPAEFHAQTAAEAALILHGKLKELGKTSDDIESVKIRTQEAAIRIIDKSGPLNNYADRDHCIQYMVAVPLIFGRLTSQDYTDEVASDSRIDALRDRIRCVEDKTYSVDYHDPEKRFISNALTITLKDGTVLDEVEVHYPVGHKRRRAEGQPLIEAKFVNHAKPHFGNEKVEQLLGLMKDRKKVENLPVNEFVDLWHKP